MSITKTNRSLGVFKKSEFKGRAFYINLHLYAAAFLTPMLVLAALSGGLYLFGIKGANATEQIPAPAGTSLDLESPSLEADVRALLSSAGIEHDFEYLKISGGTLLTRPTSRLHYEITVSNKSVTLQRNTPDLQKRMIELHKGHGPTVFRNFQKVMAIGLLYIVLAGLWLGLSSIRLRMRTIAILAAGLILFVIFAFVV